MAAKTTAPASGGKDTVIATGGDTTLVLREKNVAPEPVQKAGERGPESALEGGEGSIKQAEAKADGIEYAVQVHCAEARGGLKEGLNVVYITAESGDEAARDALAKHNYKGVSIRGVTPASDPDPNSLGGERDAAVMLENARNPGAIINTLGTEANAEATRKLAQGDISELRD